MFERAIFFSDSIAEDRDIGSQQMSFLGNDQCLVDGMITTIAKVRDPVDSRIGKRVVVAINQDEFYAS